MYYAQLDGSNICTAITQTHSPLIGPQFIELAFFDLSVLGKRWNGSGWEVVE